MLNEQECKKLCKLIDWQKLSQEACDHAAQNERLPVHLVLRVLFLEQVRMKNGLMSSGVGSGAMSPRDTYASLRRENRELKLEISRMRARLSEVEKEQVVMKQGMRDKSSRHGNTLLTSISKGIGRMGMLKQHKIKPTTTTTTTTTAASRRRRRRSTTASKGLSLALS